MLRPNCRLKSCSNCKKNPSSSFTNLSRGWCCTDTGLLGLHTTDIVFGYILGSQNKFQHHHGQGRYMEMSIFLSLDFTEILHLKNTLGLQFLYILK